MKKKAGDEKRGVEGMKNGFGWKQSLSRKRRGVEEKQEKEIYGKRV